MATDKKPTPEEIEKMEADMQAVYKKRFPFVKLRAEYLEYEARAVEAQLRSAVAKHRLASFMIEQKAAGEKSIVKDGGEARDGNKG